MSCSSDLVPLLETSCHIDATQKGPHLDATCIAHRIARLSIIETRIRHLNKETYILFHLPTIHIFSNSGQRNHISCWVLTHILHE